MWQADTFDPQQIDKELGWAQDIGFNSMRVFLHDLLWEQDSKGFLQRMDQFLTIADKHHIRILFVLFDSCWDANPHLGKQRDPIPGVHNSGWMQAPGTADLMNPSRHAMLQEYVKGVVGHFRDDKRVAFWDVWNEPLNENPTATNRAEAEMTREMLGKAFQWAREANPSQPLSSCLFTGPHKEGEPLRPIEQVQIDNSDVITFHSYDKIEDVKHYVEYCKTFGRPVICTEYMARPRGSTFDPILGYFKEQNIGAYNWGFVSGKTNTIYAWGTSKEKPGKLPEPDLWFHDIFRRDGTPFDQKEIEYIKHVTGKLD